ncbi:hypothetical protein [Persicobacter diffluens]|uniref:Uncharacterized protein n=1 Tax=Persicobacter diffluens TaxID=981 RepID=A0AAN4VTM1_9BACT|nr:hypothetical protein PEDI_04160 [Persicobacter diffluens]
MRVLENKPFIWIASSLLLLLLSCIIPEKASAQVLTPNTQAPGMQYSKKKEKQIKKAEKKRQKALKKAQKDGKLSNSFDQAVIEAKERQKQNAIKRARMEEEMKKPQYSDPSYFGHKKKPKKRPPGKKKYCKECEMYH